MTTNNGTPTAAEKLQELNAKIDAAMRARATQPYTAAELDKETLEFCRLQGREAGDLSRRLRELKEKEEEEGASVELMDAMNWAGDLINAGINMRVDEHMPPVAAALWLSANESLEGPRYAVAARVGQIARLNALLMAPEAMTHVVQGLRTTLIDADRQLAPLAGDVTPLEHTPLAVNHTIDGVICELRPDGALDVSSTALGLVRMEPREAYALGMFMRSPAAVALLEAQNALRMTEGELSFQNDPETIAERAASAR
jgi:hypothetical protein